MISSVEALSKRDMLLAKKVIQNDQLIDTQEVELEEDCLKILALYQPVATDLRFIITVLKINNDLERIADLASNIASRAIELTDNPVPQDPFDLDAMATLSKQMMRDSIAALVDRSLDSAHRVLKSDTEMNQMHVENFILVGQFVSRYPELVQSYFRFLSVSRYLERIGDLAKNIAEDVIYLIDGKIIRHAGKETT